jgi:phosphoribosyl-AMP cyclohydrolase
MTTPATTDPLVALLSAVKFDDNGLVTAIAQDESSNTILMVAWMNQDALRETMATGQAVYFSRSRQKLWRKGEESGHTQKISEIRLDCDGDVILLKVQQQGGIACHTGREHCFFRRLESGVWVTIDPVLRDPNLIYR